MVDSNITVSAINYNMIWIKGKEGVDHSLTLLAIYIGNDFKHSTNNDDLSFFCSVEFSENREIPSVIVFAVIAYWRFLPMY